MSIEINLASYLRPHADNKESVTVKGKTVGECLKDLTAKYPALKKMLFEKDGKLHDYVSVFAGGDIIYSDGLDKPVKDGDKLNILYIIGGG